MKAENSSISIRNLPPKIEIWLLGATAIAIVLGSLLAGISLEAYWNQTSASNTLGAAEDDSISLVSNLLGKLAEVSENRSVAKVAAGFDVLAGMFAAAGKYKDLVREDQTLCNATSFAAFNRTATSTSNLNITKIHVEICDDYLRVIAAKSNSPNAESVRSFFAAISDLEWALVRLENALIKDP